jgi:hypothetical protein
MERMTADLRRIALTVDEPWPGLYFWVLQEENDDAGIYEPIDASDSPAKSYQAALAAGYMALQAAAGANGPRRGELAAPTFISPSFDLAHTTIQ